MSKYTLTAFYGGTFDPIHYGHLYSINALARIVNLHKVIFIPNNIPPHKPQPVASKNQRLAMIRLALAELSDPLFTIDEREFYSSKPSYTIDTFEALRLEYGSEVPLAFIIGQDSLLTLPYWYRSQELLKLCHLLVCARPGYNNYMAWKFNNYCFTNRIINNPQPLYQQPAGLIYFATTPLLTISASKIRAYYSKNRTCNGLLPSSVHSYIDMQALYS